MRTELTTLAKRTLLAAALSCMSSAASAHGLTFDECIEGGEFIKHAAMSRDYGIKRADFLERMQADITAIQQFPPQLRWFVQDDEDAALLTGAAERVFDAPREPEAHESDFLQTCAAHVARAPDAGVASADGVVDAVASPAQR